MSVQEVVRTPEDLESGLIPISTFSYCPIKSRVGAGCAEHIRVEFDDRCPKSLEVFNLVVDVVTHAPSGDPDDSYRWPQDLSLGKRRKLAEQPPKSEEVSHLVPVVRPGTPCWSCDRGGTRSAEDTQAVKQTRRKKTTGKEEAHNARIAVRRGKK